MTDKQSMFPGQIHMSKDKFQQEQWNVFFEKIGDLKYYFPSNIWSIISEWLFESMDKLKMMLFPRYTAVHHLIKEYDNDRSYIVGNGLIEDLYEHTIIPKGNYVKDYIYVHTYENRDYRYSILSELPDSKCQDCNGCRWLNTNEIQLQKIIKIQRWFKYSLKFRLRRLIPQIMHIYYHPSCKGGYFHKKRMSYFL